MVEVVAVDRPDIEEAELLEQGAAARDHAAGEFLRALRRHLDTPGEGLGHLLGQVAQGQIGFRGEQPREIGAHRAHRRGDRHVVVVEDDDQAAVHRAGIVHRLIGHAGAHGAVADDGDDMVVAAVEVACHRHAQPGRDRCRAMGRAEGVVFALVALGEAGQPAALAERPDARPPAGQDLMRIGLVAHIPDQPVLRGLEEIVERHGQLDDAEPGAQMAAGDGDGIDRLLPQLVGELAELGSLEPAQIGRNFHCIEEGGLALSRQGLFLRIRRRQESP